MSDEKKDEKKSKVYAVDFDGTISLGKFPKTGEPNKKLIEFLKAARKQGDKVILWTCREGKYLTEALEYCKKQELEFDAVNDNLEECKVFLEGNPRKVFAHVYIDDLGMEPNRFLLNEAVNESKKGE